MKLFSTVLVFAAVLALGANLAGGERSEKRPFAEALQDLNLTDDQEAKIAAIVEKGRTKNGEALKELASVVKEEMDKVNAVLTAEQKAKLKAAKEERKDSREECLAHRIAHLEELDLTDGELAKIAEIRSEFRPKVAKAMKQLEGLFNAEQKDAREKALAAGKPRREVLAALKLTADQKATVTAVGKEVGGLVREELEQIGDVLDAGQKEQLAELKDERGERVRDRWAHRIANLKDLNLTAEQKTELAAIRQEFRPKVQAAGNKVRAAVRDELGMIVDVIKA